MTFFLSMGMVTGLAFGNLITLDAKEDAGQSPGQAAYLRFNVNNVLLPVSSTDTPFTSASDVYNYASGKGISIWLLESAGNIWSPDQVVGESLTGLHAGTYRMSPLSGAYRAYQYDSFEWSNNLNDRKWRWEMHIQAINGQGVNENDYMLGSTNPFNTADEAFNAASGSHLDISIAEGGSLKFWIYDTNSIDNSGGLSINVAAVPEPATILLLSLGLIAIPGIRRLIK